MKTMILVLSSILVSLTTLAQGQGNSQTEAVNCTVVTRALPSQSFDKALISGILQNGEAFVVKTDGTASKVVFSQLTAEEFMKLDKATLITSQSKSGQIGVAISVIDTSKLSTNPESVINPDSVAIGSDSETVVLISFAKNLGAGCALAVSTK